MKRGKTYCKKKYGIYFNYAPENNDYIDIVMKYLRKMNLISMGIIQQSIHHINFYHDEENNLEKISLNFRKLGIKPEDIDGYMLEKKKEKEGLSNYEQHLYGIWTYHHKTDRTMEYKTNKIIAKELHKLRCKWLNIDCIGYHKTSKEYQKEMEEDAENITKQITKWN